MAKKLRPQVAAFLDERGRFVQIVPCEWRNVWIGALVVGGRQEGGEFIARDLREWDVELRHWARRWPGLTPLPPREAAAANPAAPVVRGTE